MPRKVEKKQEKVISTKISADEFERLAEYARAYYIAGKLKQPTTSEILRYFIHIDLRPRKTSQASLKPST
jgi:hypothetical protein